MGTHNRFSMLLLIILHAANAFNIASETNRLEFSIPSSAIPDTTTQFGYSIGFFNTTDYKLLIGAPEFANKSGALYQCNLKGSANCIQVPIPVVEDLLLRIGHYGGAEQLGRLVRTTKNSAMVCSPMWNDETEGTKSPIPIYGRCITLSRALTVQHVDAPCATVDLNRISNNIHGYCQTGLSSGIIETLPNETYSVLASIGSWRYKGSLIATKNGELVSSFTNLIDQPIVDHEVVEVKENFTETHSLLGYATVAGSFKGPKSHGIASGAPRENTLQGEVIVYDFIINDDRSTNLTVSTKILNPENTIGSFFGASIASIDYNGDGYDDLVIGAPLYASGNGNVQGQDVGKAYIFKNTQKGTFVKESFDLTGINQKGARFGTTVTNIGDINGDGTDDLAIGAPFGGDGGKGMVFIYNVRSNSIREDFSQIIASPGAHGFGFSISAEKIDTRIYPALAVGAPLDGQVYLFQAKTVITLKDSLWVNSNRVPPEAALSNCKGPDDKPYYCIGFNLTLHDNSTNPPAEFYIDINIAVDAGNSLSFGKRAFMLDSDLNKLVQTTNQNVKFQRGGKVDIVKTVYFSTEKTTDFGSPIMITTNYAFGTPLSCENGLCAILDEFGAINSDIEVKYRRKCGHDDVCDIDLAIEQPTLKVVGSQDDSILLVGSLYEEVLLSADVINYNESAYSTNMTITFNKDFELIQIIVNEKNVDLELDDDKNKNSSIENEIQFLIANPVLVNEKYAVQAKFALRHDLRAPSLAKYDFHMVVTSTGSTDYNPKNNNKTVSIKSGIDSCLRVQLDASESNEASRLIYNPDKQVVENIESVGDVGPIVEYNFLIQNNGRKPLENMTVLLKLIDTYDNNGEQEKVTYVYELRGRSNTQCNSTGVNDGDYRIASTGASSQENVTDIADANVRSRRRRRDVEAYRPNLNCVDGVCDMYTCSISELQPGGLTGVKISFAIYLSTLKSLKSDLLELELDVQFGGKYGHFLKQRPNNCNQAITVKQPISENFPTVQQLKKKVEWWIILVAVVGALIVLAIFCAILYRIGFFKRDRPEEQQALRGQEEKYEKTNEGFEAD